MIEIVNDTFVDQTNWNYIFRYAIKVERTSDDQMLAEGSHFIGELSRQFTEQSMESHLSELYQHRQGRKYLETLSEAEKVAVKDEAQQLLIDRKSTRLNSSHVAISYAVFCLKKK